MRRARSSDARARAAPSPPRPGALALRLALPLLAALALCAPAGARTLVYCAEGSPQNFGPMLDTTGTTFDANLPIYNRLVEFKPGTDDIGPGLAESWDVSPDGLVYTFHLRRDVAWQASARYTPTRPFGADDVVFTFERQWKPDHPFHGVNGGSYDYFDDLGFATLLKAIDKLDDLTVRFTLAHPLGPFLRDLAMDFASIQSAEYGASLMAAGRPEAIDLDPIGTGPFQLTQYQKDSLIRYKANPTYWGPRPKLDALVFAITPDPTARLAKLDAGECHIAPYPNLADLGRIAADPKLLLVRSPGLNIGYLAFNVTKKPLGDVRVRRALSMAIDRQAIIDAVFVGTAEKAAGLLPPAWMSWAIDPAMADYPYDPAAAKSLLAEAGLAGGFETDLWAMPVQRPYNPDARRIAELMQADLAKVGVSVHIVSYEWGEYTKLAQAGEPMLAQFGWTGDNGDPDNFFGPIAGCTAARMGGNNIAKWCSPPFDALILKASEILDPAARAPLYREAARILHDEAPYLMVDHAEDFAPIRKEVHGFVLGPLGRHQFDGVSLE